MFFPSESRCRAGNVTLDRNLFKSVRQLKCRKKIKKLSFSNAFKQNWDMDKQFWEMKTEN